MSPRSKDIRRFILLPEEIAGGSDQRPRIRRYTLASLGHGTGVARSAFGDGDPSKLRVARAQGRLPRV